MKDAITSVKSGSVTFAVRDSKFNGLEIKTGDILGQDDDGIVCKASEVEEASIELLEKLIDAESEIVTLFYGKTLKRRKQKH